jgi:hypothetical protein
MKWFKHDTDASIDAKLQELLLDYGASGYGLYWYCVELIAQNVDEKNITFELEHDVRIISRNLNLSLQETKDMMEKMIELDLFSLSTNNRLACYTLAKRLDQSMTSNKGFRDVISKIKANSHDGVMINHDKVMQEESRREEKRVDKNREDKNRVELEKDFEQFWKAYPRKVSKDSAKKAFNKRYKELPPINELVSILQNTQWSKEIKFIPHASTWLNAGSWTDEVIIVKSGVDEFLQDEEDIIEGEVYNG